MTCTTTEIKTSNNEAFLNEDTSVGLTVFVPKGLIGFQNLNHFTMKPLVSNLEENIFWQLVAQDFIDSTDTSRKYLDLSFILMAIDFEDPIGLPHGITLKADDIMNSIEPLGVNMEDCICFLIVSVEMVREGGGQNITVNLRAPFIYHTLTKQGWQVILSGRDYPLAFPLSNG